MAVCIVKFISINIIAIISWPPLLISQLFSPRIFKATPFFTAWLSLCGCTFKVLMLAYILIYMMYGSMTGILVGLAVGQN